MNKFKPSIKLPKGRDLAIQTAMILLALFGWLMITSASMSTHVVPLTLLMVSLKQLAFILVGYLGYSLLARYFSLQFVQKYIVWIMVFTQVMLIAPLFFPAINGANAWIVIKGVGTLQPSEFAKIVVVLVFAIYLGDSKRKKISLTDFVKIPFFFLSMVCILVVFFQGDTGTAIVIVGMAFCAFMLAGHSVLRRSQLILIFLLILGLCAVYLVLTPSGISFLRTLGFLKEYQLARFENTLNPFVNRYGTGYQLVSSLVAFVRGDWFGVGYGMGLQKYGYLPYAKTDFILAVIAEETGFVGVLFVLVTYAVFIGRLFKHALKATHERSRMILVGIAMYAALHFILNVGGVIALIPLTGVPLLLLSAGGSSTLSLMFSLGIAQNIIATQAKESSES